MVRDWTKVSKYMAYLLRHDPSGLDISEEGFVNLDDLLEKLRERWPDLEEDEVRELVREDSKGRYEILDGKIRARYGHSIDVEPDLSETRVQELYHGTTPQASEKILEEGLEPQARQKVHLSPSVDEAVQVGKRRTDNPAILKIDVDGARKAGVNIERASDRVYVSDFIPPRFISPK